MDAKHSEGLPNDGESADSLLHIRRQKRDAWRTKGFQPYPTAQATKPQHLAAALHAEYDGFSKEDLEAKRTVDSPALFSIAGRIMLHRSFGKAAFLTLQDRSGRLQIYAQSSKLSADAYEFVKHADLGDIVFAEGTLFKTKTGELSIDATKFVLVSKNVRPLPEKFHGLQDVEARYRQRYLDLISSEHSKQVFRMRSQLIHFIRDFFFARDYLEVETPMLHPLVGGARARPFKTFHNTLKMDLFLRIAPELYLKRLVVGGLERVFELNRCFRNEGISVKHNPEFSMLEFYEAYATYEDLMNMTEELLEGLCVKLRGAKEIEYQGQKISFARPFRRFTVTQVLQEYGMKDPSDKAALQNALKKKGVDLKHLHTVADLQWAYFEEFVEAQLIQPTYVMDHPIEVSPLARRSEKNPDVAERFELYIAGREIANGFNELNDPDDQKGRFLDQLKRKEAGDEEASDFDEDYIHALEVGLPPTAGEGIGIDRLTMLFTDSASIRDVILFPQLRSSRSSASEHEN